MTTEPSIVPVRDYVYDAKCLKVGDGDTITLDVDLGVYQHAHLSVRLEGYDTAGRYSEPGKRATAYLKSLLYEADGDPRALVVQTIKDRDDKYGRLLARVWVKSLNVEVRDEMVGNGFGLWWDGTGPHPEQEGKETSH